MMLMVDFKQRDNIMSRYDEIQRELIDNQYTWLITGAAGFIGSNLVEKLLILNQKVVGLDNFETGYQHNLDQALEDAQTTLASNNCTLSTDNFRFIEGDIRDVETCHEACKGVDYVLHQAALGSVPRSIENPILTNENNITGFLNMLQAAKESKVKSFTYAASSSTYGDHPDLPKKEEVIGSPLSPYAVTKLVNELYAKVFQTTYNFNTIGLRYFNIFGKHQNPSGSYAAVIPKWILAMKNGHEVVINGDGTTSRDFCFIENAVQANILAALAEKDSMNNVYNVAVGESTSLISLFNLIRKNLGNQGVSYNIDPVFQDFRIGDVKHSLADISKAYALLGYRPQYNIRSGIAKTVDWYLNN